jgi:fructose-bisphosphate aldolase, class II
MALITLRQLRDQAAEHEYGVPAFNVNNLDPQVPDISNALGARLTGRSVTREAKR